MKHDSSAESGLRSLICFNFYRGWRGVSEFYKYFLPEGISAQQSYLLELCDAREGMLVSALAAELEIDISAISAMLRRMEASQLIRRETPPHNRRQTLVFLTPQGAALRRRIRTAMLKADQALSRFISAEDRKQLTAIVDNIRALLDDAQQTTS